MAKKKKKHLAQKFHGKYDVADIIMEYVAALIPNPDSPDMLDISAEQARELIDNTIFICTSSWNYAALPPDCGAIMINKFKETLDDDVADKEILDMILDIAEDMRDKYPEPDVTITNHKLITTDNGIDFGVEVVSLEKYVQAIREEM